MLRPSPILASAALALVAALAACSPSRPPESPEGASEPAAQEKPSAETPKESKEAPAGAEPQAQPPAERSPAPKPEVDRSLSLDSYEITPSDCNALGRHYGEVARSDQMAGLSPKLTEKQRSTTAAQIDKVVGALEEKWTSGCHATLVNKAVDHQAIKCALGAKTVKDFDVCLNGGGASSSKPPAKPKN